MFFWQNSQNQIIAKFFLLSWFGVEKRKKIINDVHRWTDKTFWSMVHAWCELNYWSLIQLLIFKDDIYKQCKFIHVSFFYPLAEFFCCYTTTTNPSRQYLFVYIYVHQTLDSWRTSFLNKPWNWFYNEIALKKSPPNTIVSESFQVSNV